MTASLTNFPAGHTFTPIVLEIDAVRVAAYLDATSSSLSLYHDEAAAPPLAVAAFALGALLESVGLPPGTLHVSEALDFHKPVPIGSHVECRASLAQRSQRSGWVVSVLESQIMLEGELAIKARASVMSPAGQA